ncbi:MAG: hypothetical protein Q8P26_02015 [Candidatus Levybacteria bacterium]|nr:hypothetical protein [Candidatus Levybacteria bacterium]
MRLNIPIVNTSSLPYTSLLLKKNIPSILWSKCFNPNKYSFPKEVQKTEIGHLFEHILLECLSQQRIKDGKLNSVFNGLTQWDWTKEARGTFHITIDVGYNDKKTFEKAIEKSISIIRLILEVNSQNYLDKLS